MDRMMNGRVYKYKKVTQAVHKNSAQVYYRMI